jgi:hypothetical protein
MKKSSKPYKFVAFQPRECQRCGHKWIPVITCANKVWKQAVPKECPACKSIYWNEERERSEWDNRYKAALDKRSLDDNR